jgi:hypothetical protein
MIRRGIRFGRWWLAPVVVGLLLATGAVTALAFHDFTDVGDDDFFHDDVSWLKANAITLGCTPTDYCPDDNVTRGQMAAFLHRIAAVENTGHFSCPGTGFRAVADATRSWPGGSGVQTSDGGVFTCNAVLPHGATVRSVSFAVQDATDTAEVMCKLWRNNLVTSPGSGSVMGDAGATGVVSAPGDTQLSTAVIADAVVNNSAHTYSLSCTLGAGFSIRLWGATVEYTTLGVPAP